jgi:hypothetical protein
MANCDRRHATATGDLTLYHTVAHCSITVHTCSITALSLFFTVGHISVLSHPPLLFIVIKSIAKTIFNYNIRN